MLTYPDDRGLWQRPEHFDIRSQCIQYFVDLLRQNPLKSTSWSVSADLKDRTRDIEDASETVEADEWVLSSNDL